MGYIIRGSLGFINFLDHLTCLTETFYLLDCGSIIKGITQEQPNERYRARYGEGMQNFHALSKTATLSEHPCVVYTPRSSELHPFGFLWGIPYIGMVDLIHDHWWLIQPLAPLIFLEVGVVGLKVSTLQSLVWLHQQGIPILRWGPKFTSSKYQRHLYDSHHLGNSKGFRSSVPKMGIYIFIINHKITCL